MNKLTIIGNLTRDPELRTTSAGINVCDFTVAVNRRVRRDAQSSQPEADFFRVSAWRQLGENCAKFLAKGRKVCVVGPVSVRTYQSSDGTTRASLEVTAEDVEFLSSRNDGEAGAYSAPAAAPAAEPQAAGFTAVETDELPF
ncbi:MAG: single-stranded DNA-binding protein [Clostridia bacterium]|jgi:single-strand DNA-binding protein|nr:single-stranded DNA-binding protein [Clostridia bacterium]MBR4576512.1 single-stranded DNA-binding protein [Clostridia bacterium]